MRLNLVLCSIVMLLCAPLAALRGQGGGAMRTEIFPLGALTEAQRHVPGWPVGLPLRGALRDTSQAPALVWEVQEEGGLSADLVVELVSASVGDAAWVEEGASRSMLSGKLWVRHRPDVLRKIGEDLARLERTAIHRARVVIHSIPLPAEVPGAVLGADVVQQLLRGAGPHPQATLMVEHGGSQRLRSGVARSFVPDKDVEVAQDAEIADPTVRVLRAGMDLRVALRLLPDATWYLRVGGRVAHVDSIEESPTGSTWVGRIQRASVSSTVVAGSGVVVSGGGILAGLVSGAEGQRALLVEVQGRPAAGQGTQGRLHVIPAGLAGLPTLGLPPLAAYGPLATGAPTGAREFEDEPSSFFEGDTLMDGIRRSVEPRIWDEAPDVNLQYYAPNFYVVGPERLATGVRRFLVEAHRGAVSTVGLEFRAGSLDLAAAQALTRAGADLGAVASALEYRGCVATTVGDSFRLVRGREQTYLRDQDVEIAQEATIADPIVDVLFDGFAVEGHLARATGHGLVLSAEFVYRDLVEPVAGFSGDASDVGVVDTPHTSAWQTRAVLPLAQGGWSLVGVAPLAGSSRSLAILVRARAP